MSEEKPDNVVDAPELLRNFYARISLPDQDVPKAPSSLAVQEQQEEARIGEKTRLEVELQGLRQDIGDRRLFARLVYGLVVGWLVLVLAAIAATGAGWLALSDSVLRVLLGTTTLNVLGPLYLVMRYLFGRNGSSL